MREELNRQLRFVQDDLLRMSSRVEHAVALAVNALITWDGTLAQQVISRDSDVDAEHIRLEDTIFNLLATQQPIVGRDLRMLYGALFIATELERMGDYAKGMARRVLVCLRAPMLLAPPAELLTMATFAQQMLKTAIESLIRMDPVLARSLGGFDEQVDALDNAVQKALVILARDDLRRMEAVIALHDITHHIERLADRATNIAERVIFVATSSIETLNIS